VQIENVGNTAKCLSCVVHISHYFYLLLCTVYTCAAGIELAVGANNYFCLLLCTVYTCAAGIELAVGANDALCLLVMSLFRSVLRLKCLAVLDALIPLETVSLNALSIINSMNVFLSSCCSSDVHCPVTQHC